MKFGVNVEYKFLLTSIFFILIVPLIVTNAEAQPEAQSARVERLEVTGSHIKKIDVEGPSPVQILDREYLDNSGHNSVADVLRDITATAFGSEREQSGYAASGKGTANLRGLGNDRTLVLLDGKRLPIDPHVEAVNLNLIPMGAVQRIDILRDGASATYGSDALGGVINIITRKDFVGSQVNIRSSINKNKGGERNDISLLHGHATHKFRILGNANFKFNEKINRGDREWTKSTVTRYAAPANRQAVISPNNNVNSVTSYHADRLNNTGTAPDVQTNVARDMDFIPRVQQFNTMIQADYKINQDLNLYARFIGNQERTKYDYGASADAYLLPPSYDGVAIPGGYNYWLVRDRFLELENRNMEGKATTLGGQLGLRGYFFDTWSWDISYDYNRLKRDNKNSKSYLLKDRFDTLIATGGYNPFLPMGSRIINQTGYDEATYKPWSRGSAENHFVEGKATGEVFYLLGRPVSLAVGASFSKENFEIMVSDETKNGNVMGLGGSTGRGERQTISTYSELSYNPIESLEIQLAGRFDNYDDFGSTLNPKLGLRWQVNSQLMLRASAGTGFKAPNLVHLYQAAASGYIQVRDAYYCQNSSDPDACKAVQQPIITSGNNALKEEKSRAYNLGAVYQIARKTHFGLDLWKMNLTNMVMADYDELLSYATKYEAINGVGSAATHGVTIPRDGTGKIAGQIIATPKNLGSADISGFDLSFEHQDENLLGNMSIKTEQSILLEYKRESFPTFGSRSILRTHKKPKWKNNTTFGYTPWFHKESSLYLIAKTVSKHHIRDDSKREYLKRYTEWDFQYNLRFPWNGSLTLGAVNVFGGQPPLDKTAGSNQLVSDLYNSLGQSFYLQYTHSL